VELLTTHKLVSLFINNNIYIEENHPLDKKEEPHHMTQIEKEVAFIHNNTTIPERNNISNEEHHPHITNKLADKFNMFEHKHEETHHLKEEHHEPIITSPGMDNKIKLLNKVNNSPNKMKMFGMPRPDKDEKVKLIDIHAHKEESIPIKLIPSNIEHKENINEDSNPLEKKEEDKTLKQETSSKTNVAKLMKRITSAKGMLKQNSEKYMEQKQESAKIMGLAAMLQNRLIKPAIEQTEEREINRILGEKVVGEKKKLPFFMSGLDSDVQVLDDEKIKDDIQIKLDVYKSPIPYSESTNNELRKEYSNILLEKPIIKKTTKKSKAIFKAD
jgi:hypothetical protein